MLPILLNTVEITEVASPSASSLEYERMSLSQDVTPYTPYSPFKIRLNQFLEERPSVRTMPAAPTAATAADTVPTLPGRVKPSPSISVTMLMVRRYTMPPPTSIYQKPASKMASLILPAFSST